uniref:Uncharacterized protein n=1 Tax=Macrostomum lignano TaxID=282301 RepID=A0A1I8JPV2_9PLAT
DNPADKQRIISRNFRPNAAGDRPFVVQRGPFTYMRKFAARRTSRMTSCGLADLQAEPQPICSCATSPSLTIPGGSPPPICRWRFNALRRPPMAAFPNETLFPRLSVRDVAFGYHDKLLRLAHESWLRRSLTNPPCLPAFISVTSGRSLYEESCGQSRLMRSGAPPVVDSLPLWRSPRTGCWPTPAARTRTMRAIEAPAELCFTSRPCSTLTECSKTRLEALHHTCGGLICRNLRCWLLPEIQASVLRLYPDDAPTAVPHLRGHRAARVGSVLAAVSNGCRSSLQAGRGSEPTPASRPNLPVAVLRRCVDKFEKRQSVNVETASRCDDGFC